jgi:hypothetical protein
MLRASRSIREAVTDPKKQAQDSLELLKARCGGTAALFWTDLVAACRQQGSLLEFWALVGRAQASAAKQVFRATPRSLRISSPQMIKTPGSFLPRALDVRSLHRTYQLR